MYRVHVPEYMRPMYLARIFIVSLIFSDLDRFRETIMISYQYDNYERRKKVLFDFIFGIEVV